MHDDEVQIDHGLVVRLVAEQFPRLAGLPIREVRSTGTVNAIYRLGDALYVRLPRVGTWSESIDREWTWLPRLAPRLPLRIPEPVHLGVPTPDYPFPWAIFDWIEGRPYDDEVQDEREVARELAGFVRALRAVPRTTDAPPGGRRPLRELDAGTRATIQQLPYDVDGVAALAAWEDALLAPRWVGEAVWVHADLLRPNVLVQGGRLTAVIDFGGAGVGDPAMDVIAAWAVFGRDGRDEYRRALDVDDGVWLRARGIALHQAAAIIPYYRDSNPAFVVMAKRTVEQVLDDIAS